MGPVTRVALSAVLLSVAAVSFAAAVATEQSVLSCDQTEASSGQNVTCAIMVRDSMAEGTVGVPGDFTVHVKSVPEAAGATAFAVRPTSDPSVLAFSVGCATGARLRIDVRFAKTGQLIKKSGAAVLVFATPPTALGAVVCDAATLTLRPRVPGRAPVAGAGGVPALATAKDIFLSEDHGDGEFRLVSGNGALVVQFTAPVAPSMTYDRFVVRIALAPPFQAEGANLTFPLHYPAAAPAPRSTLRCSAPAGAAHGPASCVLAAFDAAGPVEFNPALLRVSFERDDTVGGAPRWTAADDSMASTWETSVFPATGVTRSLAALHFHEKERNDVFRARVHVKVAATGADVVGSPYQFRSGVPPTAETVAFHRCRRAFITAGSTTECALTFGAGVSADPAFVAVSVSAGRVTRPAYRNGTGALAGRRLVVFSFTAPAVVSDRVDVFVAATIGGIEVAQSPYIVKVYPATAIAGVNGDGEQHNVRILLIGIGFFGTGLAVGVAHCLRRRTRQQRVRENRRRQKHQSDAAVPFTAGAAPDTYASPPAELAASTKSELAGPQFLTPPSLSNRGSPKSSSRRASA
jgi:hypothetical protein